MRSQAHAKCGRPRMAPSEPLQVRLVARASANAARAVITGVASGRAAGALVSHAGPGHMRCPPWPPHGCSAPRACMTAAAAVLKSPDLTSCRVGCACRRPLGLAACARCGMSAARHDSGPNRVRARIEWRPRRARCAPRSARSGCGGRGADAAPARGRHPRGRRPMASSGARRRGGRGPGPALRARPRRPRHPQGVPLARGLVGLCARGRGAARLRLRLSAQPRLRRLGRGLRTLAQAQAGSA
jgi:hypothetical protein